MARTTNNTNSTRTARRVPLHRAGSGNTNDAQGADKVASVASPASVKNVTSIRPARDPQPFVSLFVEEAGSYLPNSTEGELLLIEAWRKIRAADASPEARAEFEAWDVLRNEVDNVLKDEKPSIHDVASEPGLYYAAQFVARFIRSYRPSHLFGREESEHPTPRQEAAAIAEHIVDLLEILLRELNFRAVEDWNRVEAGGDNAVCGAGGLTLDALADWRAPDFGGSLGTREAVDVFAVGLYGEDNIPYGPNSGREDRLDTIFRVILPIVCGHKPGHHDTPYYLLHALGEATERFYRSADETKRGE